MNRNEELLDRGFEFVGRYNIKPERKLSEGNIITTDKWLEIDFFKNEDGNLIAGEIYPTEYVHILAEFGF